MKKASLPGKIIIVSNRLPVTLKKSEAGIVLERSSGGLATGLSSLMNDFEIVWVGWPGVLADEDHTSVEAILRNEHKCHPVFIPQSLVERYYDGYSNRTIWPIFHSLPSLAKNYADEWEAYKEANTLFSQKVLEVYRPGDIVWIHDYHLTLLPGYLRARVRDMTLGFFLHIPFPHYDVFRMLPQHREILESLLAFDLIGFHTHDYAQAFLGAVRRLLGYDNTLGQLNVGDRIVQVDIFPMGIDFEKYSRATADVALQDEIVSIRNSLKTEKTVFSVSRLDYTKGIPESIEAIAHFLRRHSEWLERVVFILVVVPSRESVDRYASLKREIDELVGRTNSAFGTLEWQPIRYIYRSLTFGELVGLYSNADVALIVPLRDGMNLIAKEYLATRQDGAGVLILSELAGASKELLEAITINPNSMEGITQAIHDALVMPPEEQRRRLMVMRERLRVHDLYSWVRRFLMRLGEVQETSSLLGIKMLKQSQRFDLLSEFAKASSRLVILDYDGTLVSFVDEPATACPDDGILKTLESIASESLTHLVILSGRDRHTLSQWLGHLPLTLVAEHGAWYRLKGTEDWVTTMSQSMDAWKKDIRPILELFVGRIPESMIEEKDFSLVWHYRKADSDSASFAARELLDTLATLAANLNVQVLPGNKAIEIRTMGVSKGAFYLKMLQGHQDQFILAVGDDWTDEDLFGALPPGAYSIKVGRKLSKARYNVKNVHQVRSLLEGLARQKLEDAQSTFALPTDWERPSQFDASE
jgi:trehalose 6-phosphate synthase/phosphatase